MHGDDLGSDHTGGLIVGAVPTGLVLAIVLQQAGVKHVLIDKLAHGQNASRAPVIRAHIFEVLTRSAFLKRWARAVEGSKRSAFETDIGRLMAINFLPRKS
jgi:2-polyprenyl-6-methoxyphenol hydroxylase-like FAD-dependent oxidoreductase